MTLQLVLTPEAKADAAQAFRWYEEQSPGLGMEFLRCTEALIQKIQQTPRLYPVVHEGYRRALIRRFPYAIFYEIEASPERCVVFSIFHGSQDPEKWRTRLTGR